MICVLGSGWRGVVVGLFPVTAWGAHGHSATALAPAPMASLFFPVLGVILSNALYFSSTPVIIQASRRGTLGSLNPLPLALMCVSTVSWMCCARSRTSPIWPVSAALAAGWSGLAGASGSLRLGLALREASGEHQPADS